MNRGAYFADIPAQSIKHPLRLILDMTNIGDFARHATQMADVWLAECELADLQNYFSANRVEYCIQYPEDLNLISTAFLVVRRHLKYCEDDCKLELNY